MTAEPLTVCVAGLGEPRAEVVAALLADGRRAMVVPGLDDGSGPRPGRAAALGPWSTVRAARTGRFAGPPGDLAIASVIAVPSDLLESVGGPDPRFASVVGWADLLERLRVVEPDLPVVDADDLAVPVSASSDDRRATDLHLHAANRPSLAWRLAARLARPRSLAPPPSAGEQVRRLLPPTS